MGKKLIKIRNSDIDITIHPVDGFTLSFRDKKDNLFKQRYIGYSKREAKRRFKESILRGEIR